MEEETGKKRKRNMIQTSTPVHERRDTKIIDMEEDSPINRDTSGKDQSSVGSNESIENIPTSKKKAGISDDVHVMAVTPPCEWSPDTMDRRLAEHCVDIVRASKNNEMVLELQENVEHSRNLTTNIFAKRSDGSVGVGARVDPVEDTDEGNQDAAIVDARNTGSTSEQAVAMDEMNKTPYWGVNGLLLWMK